MYKNKSHYMHKYLVFVAFIAKQLIDTGVNPIKYMYIYFLCLEETVEGSVIHF